MNKEPAIFLGHILDCIQHIKKYTRGVTWEEFEASEQLQDSVFRRLEIMGEAVKNLPPDFREEHPEIPWRKIAGFRDVLIHNYMGVDIELAWNIVTYDLLLLRKNVSSILKGLKSQK
jgi:uncharacterized protein with HEPN domain